MLVDPLQYRNQTHPGTLMGVSVYEAALSSNVAGSNPTDNPQEMSERLEDVTCLVLACLEGFHVRGSSCESFSPPLESLKQMDCLAWSRWGPSKSESISDSLEYYLAGHGGAETY